MNKTVRIISLVGVLALAGVCVGETTKAKVGKKVFTAAPASVSWVVAGQDGTDSGIGVFSLRVQFGDDAVAANTLTWQCISARSGLTNTCLTRTFTNSYTYAPTPIYFEVGDTMVISNTQTGADINMAYKAY